MCGAEGLVIKNVSELKVCVKGVERVGGCGRGRGCGRGGGVEQKVQL